MDSNFSSNPQKKNSGQSHPVRNYSLILHNDDVNSFDYVMEVLTEVCGHSALQAEQCAMLTHYKGSCEIKIGSASRLRDLKHELISRGLTATVE